MKRFRITYDMSAVSLLESREWRYIKANNNTIVAHTHTCVCHYRVPGEIKRREEELDPQSRRVHEQGGGAGLRKLDFFRFGLFLNSSATDIVLVTLPSTTVETATAQCTSRWAMARGHRLNTSIVLAAVHGLSGLFRAVSAVEP